MNTTALKSFAQEARQLLREGVERRLIYWGFDKTGNNTEKLEAVTGGYMFRGKVSDDTSVSGKWHKLKAAISNTSFDEVVEKAAYTWFNRLMAIKILSQHGYETAQLDYLSEETNTPAILERARRGQYSFLTTAEQNRLQPLLTDYEKEQEAFAILLIGFCHQHPLLQGIFGSIDDYTELLLPDDILKENGFLYFLNATDAISEEDYKQVELIGWIYQFYISEKKDEVFAGFKQNKKAEAKDIPAATQIFTPKWIVKYLVQNTIGRTWLDANPESDLKKDWKYLVEPSIVNDQLSIASDRSKEIDRSPYSIDHLTFLDPAVGSGHILVEAFEILYPMYMEEYYSPEEAVQCILEKNLFGLDIDLRAVQLAQFAIILKAAQHSLTVLEGKTLPHIYSMPQHRTFSKEEVVLFLGKENSECVNQLYTALQIMAQAYNLGSIMMLELSDKARKLVLERYEYWTKKATTNFDEEIVKEVFSDYIPILDILTDKFACIAANPPYMGRGNMNGSLKQYLEEKYPNSKSDLYTVFIEVCKNKIKKNGRIGLINPPSWMFNISYTDLRKGLVEETRIESFLNFGRGIFGADFGTVCYIIKYEKPNLNRPAIFRSLFRGKSLVDSIQQKEEWFLKTDFNTYSVNQLNFLKISSCPFSYWLPDKVFDLFNKLEKLEDIADAKQGMATSDNDRFRRDWPEVSRLKIGYEGYNKNKKWYPYNSGGQFRKWYGNQFYLINWENNGSEIVNFKKSVVRSPQFYFQESISWSKVTIGGIAFRYFPQGFIFDVAGCSIFTKDRNLLKYLLGLLNSSLKEFFIYAVSQSVNYEVGIINNIPIVQSGNFDKYEKTLILINSNILLAQVDWDSRETSWNFQSNALLFRGNNIEQSYQAWLLRASKDFFQLHANEEDLNRIFINIYSLQDELSPDVLLKDVTILQDELDYETLGQLQKPYEGQLLPVNADLVMQQFISYAVGCYMGRYRLDKPGLHIAHPSPTDEELVPYSVTTKENRNFLFSIDDDAIIPLMGRNGNFTDDMFYRINEFLTIVWGDDTLTANLNFLQQQLGKDLEDYLVKDFWKYHVRTYSKKPIYWLFASKKGAFQVLVYMHRMNAYTPAQIRSKYLIPHISWLQGQVRDMEKNAASLSKVELKTLDTRRKQLAECEEYDLLLKDIADKQISFDLDDGVTKNYALFERVVAVIK